MRCGGGQSAFIIQPSPFASKPLSSPEMVHFPSQILSLILSYNDHAREAHAKVWQKIRVKRCVLTTSVSYEADFTEDHQGKYFVYSTGGECDSPYASIATVCFLGSATAQSNEWDNVSQELEIYNPDDSYFGTTYEWHNYEFGQYGEYE
jgi:hypothetical protein